MEVVRENSQHQLLLLMLHSIMSNRSGLSPVQLYCSIWDDRLTVAVPSHHNKIKSAFLLSLSSPFTHDLQSLFISSRFATGDCDTQSLQLPIEPPRSALPFHRKDILR
ncbi:hypothetical protein Plhal710r2_c010g0048181 [Plasmopara halstedii]